MKRAHGVKIRAYSDMTDRNRLTEIWLDASRVGHPFLSESDLLDQQAKVRDIYLPQAENWVAELDGKSVAFIGLIDSFIGGLFVAPAAHGHGLGKALVLHAAGIKGALEVEVYAANKAAVGFYQRGGFVEVLRHSQDDEGRPLEVIRMRRAG
ncbi:GNAT family N-acetyltransferase [Mesorhizobium sp. ANAO-SY3R2]|uniref:GNAT family N-acetyltransferase n=1 Tax=Mesorhizobium sp. ANAO-SY3R2 TaxID=3166644 RepID=UPI00366BD404